MRINNARPADAIARARSDRLRSFLQAFQGAPISTTDFTPEHYNPYRRVRRLMPNSDVWKPYGGKYIPRIIAGPGIRFCQRPQVRSRMLSCTLGRTLQWIALNPTLTVVDLAKAMNRSEPALRNDIQKLRSRGILYQTKVWAIHPLLIGEGRLFNETSPALPIPEENPDDRK